MNNTNTREIRYFNYQSYFSFMVAMLIILLLSCNSVPRINDEMEEEPKLIFKLRLDGMQDRLNGIGQLSQIDEENGSQIPSFSGLSVHVIDLTPNRFTPYGDGCIVFKGQETDQGGSQAIDFNEANILSDGEIMVEIPIDDVKVGTYEYARISVAYQNYDVKFDLHELPNIGSLENQKGRIASFVGYNTYIEELKVNDMIIEVNNNKTQGFWAFETSFEEPYANYNQVYSGQSVGTTVVNPLVGDSEIPLGSCVVTGGFEEPLIITGNESEDIEVILSFSINHSFEWKDTNGNGKWDIYLENQSLSEKVEDMGLRGLKAFWQ